MKWVSVYEMRRQARRTLPKMVYDYLEGGALDERTLRSNPTSYQNWRFLPRRLIDLSAVRPETSMFGRDIAFPAVVAPTGLNSLFWPRADLALARAAQRCGIPFTLSTASSMSLEQVAELSAGRLWFQLYVIEPGLALSLVERAKAAGYECLVVTVDVVANGKRERDLRNGFGLPVRYSLRTLWDGLCHPAWSWRYLRHGLPVLGNFNASRVPSPEARAALLRRSMDESFDWAALDAIRQNWPGKMLVKGVLHPDDIERCRKMGIDGVVLSNHGGRQLDDTCSPLDVLAQLAPTPGFDILVDGGIRRGSDIAKAVALGARAVMLGRAALYGLACGGEAGVSHALSLLQEEYRNTLVQLGCPDTALLDAGYVRRATSAEGP